MREEIAPGRLKAMPLAGFCVFCQENFEREMRIQGKGEEDLTYKRLTESEPEEEES